MGVWIISALGIPGVAFLAWVLIEMSRDGSSHRGERVQLVHLRTVQYQLFEEFEDLRELESREFRPESSRSHAV